MFNKILEDFEKNVPTSKFEKTEIEESSSLASEIARNVSFRYTGTNDLRKVIDKAFDFVAKRNSMTGDDLRKSHWNEVTELLRKSMSVAYEEIAAMSTNDDHHTDVEMRNGMHSNKHYDPVRLVKESGEVYDKKNFDLKDPEILVHGYGRLNLSTLKRKVSAYLKKASEMDDIDSIDDLLNKGVLRHFIRAIKDVEAELATPQMKRKATIRSRKAP